MSSLRDRIQAGKEGKYKGLDNGLGDINHHIFNIQRGYFTLIGGQSGSSKTTLLDFMFLHAIYAAQKEGKKIIIFYYSYEINELTKKLNWLSVHIYRKYGVEIQPTKIGGLGGLKMTPEEEKLVDDETDYIEDLFKSIHFRFEPQNPTGIFKELMGYAGKNGKFIKEKYYIEEQEHERIIRYEANDPEEYVLIGLDHIALSKKERGFTLKDNIDKLSEYLIFIRNICKYSPFVIQQFNSSLSSMDRLKLKGMDISPQQSDFKDSTNIYTDADIVLGLMNPWKIDFKVYLGHDLTILKDKFRLIKLIKSRVGRDNLAFGYIFNGARGSFKYLPKAEDVELFGGYDKYLV